MVNCSEKLGDINRMRHKAVRAKCLLLKQEVCQDENRLDLDNDSRAEKTKRKRKKNMKKGGKKERKGEKKGGKSTSG